MKLKNSYILLIAMSLFLLISIGSVCAEDTGATDANLLSDDGTNIVLSDDGDSGQSDNGDSNITQEKIDTTVESEDALIRENDPVEIPVTVKDNESSQITVTKNNLTVSEGSKTIKFDYNNSKLNITDKLAIGNHSLTITYLGNDIYKNSTTNIILSIFGDKTIDAPSFVTSDGVSIEIPVTVTDGVHTYSVIKDNLTLNLTYVDENGNSSYKIIDVFDIEKNTVKFLLNDLKFASASVVLKYSDETESSKKVAIKLLTNVTAQNAKFNESDNKTIPISVVSGEKQLNVTKNEIKVFENDKEITSEYADSVVTIKSLTPGNHTLTIKFMGNDNFAESSKDILVSVYGNITINVDSSVDVNSTKKGQITIKNVTNGVDLIGYTLDDLSISASYKVGNDTLTANVKIIKLENNTLFFEFADLNFTTATLNVAYKHATSANATVNRIYNAKIVVVTGKNQYENGAFKFKLVDVDNNKAISGKTVSLYTIGNIRAGFSATTDKNGVAQFYTKNLYEFDNTNNTFTMKQFEVGKHGVEISTSGDVKSTTLKTNLTITKAEIKIVIKNFKEVMGTDKNVTITVTNKNDGSAIPGIILRLDMPQTSGKTYYFQTDSNGQSKVSVKQLIGGTYTLTVSNNDTKNMKSAKTTKKIVIVPKPAVITAKNTVIFYNCGKTATIKVTDKKTGKALSGIYVTVQLFTGKKSKTYLFQTNSKGTFTFSASLDVGKHKMIVKTADNRYQASKVTKYITVKKVPGKLIAPRVVSYYRGGKYFIVTLLNGKNKPIYDAKININGKYSGNTGADGKLRLSFDTLGEGTYKITVSGGAPKNYAAKQVTSLIVVKKAPTVLTPTKLVAKKGANKYFTVAVKNAKTKKIIKGVKLKVAVYTGKTYKIYNIYSNSKGIAKLNVKSLSVGTHKVVVASANKNCVAKAKASWIKITK